MDYNELFECLRKEKYAEQLQLLPKIFVSEFSEYIKEQRKKIADDVDFFSESVMKEKKQLENSMSLFRELMLRRKKKILNLVFVASETGIMKRDFGNMLSFEQTLFENLVLKVDEADKSLAELLAGKEKKESSKLLIANQRIEEFVDMEGNIIGPFEKSELIHIDPQVAEILVGDGKAKFID